jgi:hypothetical protein
MREIYLNLMDCSERTIVDEHEHMVEIFDHRP